MPHRIPQQLTADGYPVVAWLPSNSYDDEFAAVIHRPEPACADAPYAVMHARPSASAPFGWRCFHGVYDLPTVADAIREALTFTGWESAA